MKKFATLLVLLSIGLFTLGCGDTAAKKPATPAKPAAPAASDTKAPGAAPAEPAKDAPKTEKK